MSNVTTRGQITIDQTARKALNVQPGTQAVQIVVGDHLEVYFLPPRHRRSLFGVLATKIDPDTYDWDAIREAAADAIARDA
ncbi:MAG: AbrB family transcriptional regulator [Chloroflexota bacterium]|nr:MAG: AbrB family transcriptional regulator [Chloroflexota bacterium]